MPLELTDFVPPLFFKGRRWVKKRAAALLGRQGVQSADYYDRVYGESEKYVRHYAESIYYPSWTIVVDRLLGARCRRVLDIGCGPGQFAAFLRDRGISDYVGVDFSARAIEMAKSKVPELRFVVDDALQCPLIAEPGWDAVVSLEFLEHVEFDLEVLARVQAGTRVIATVPNFPSQSHVRHFVDVEEVRERYRRVLDDLRVDVVRLNGRDTALYVIDGRRAG